MTVIAWDGKVLAADRQTSIGSTISTTRKIWKLKSGAMLAVSGTLDAALVLKKWYEDGADPTKWPLDFQKGTDWGEIIVVTEGRVLQYQSTPEPIEALDEFMAWGVGCEAALGAMAMGSGAIKAVEIASRFVLGCGNGCDYMCVEEEQ